MTHTMGPKGQVVIPKGMRDAIGLRAGDDVEFAVERGAVRVEPAHPRLARAGLLAGHRLVEAIESEHLDLAAYTRRPLTDDELAVADLPVRLDLADEDVDYEALYGTAE